MLAANLTVDILTSLPSELVGGTKQKVQVAVANEGDAPAVGAQNLRFYLSTDAQWSAGDREVGSILNKRLNLGAGRAAKFSATLTLPGDVLLDDYVLLAVADADNQIAEGNESDNAGASDPFSLVRPFADVGVEFLTQPSGEQGVKPKKSVSAKVVWFNEGNVPLKLKGTLRYYASEDGTLNESSVLLKTTFNQAFSLKVGAGKVLSASIKVPATLWNGTYRLVTVLTPNAGQIDRNRSNNQAISGGVFRVVESVALAPSAGVLALTPSTTATLAGDSQQVVFTARVRGAESGQRVRLFRSDASGSIDESDFLLDLYDDASPIHADELAGDGLYTNTFALEGDVAGEQFFAALLEGSDAAPAITSIEVMLTPDQSRLIDLVGAADDFNTLFYDELDEGAGLDEATAAFLQALQSEPDLVDQSTITLDYNGLSWKSPEGMGFMLYFDTPGVRDDDGLGRVSALNEALRVPVDEDACQTARVIAPYKADFEPSDESDNIAALLANAGWDIAASYDSSSVEEFKGLGQYDAVVISSHGDSSVLFGDVINTNHEITVSSLLQYAGDVITGRLCIGMTNSVTGLSADFLVTDSFFRRYSGQFDEAIVYVSACRSYFYGNLATTFAGLGAAGYIGYSDYVDASFAFQHGLDAFQTLLQEGKTLGDIAGINDPSVQDSGGAYMRGYNASATLPNDCDLLRDYDLYVSYTWPVTQRDLDSGTLFLGGRVGFACGGSPYMTFSGDDTTAGGQEVATVKLFQSWDTGNWADSVIITAAAGWYIPAGGSGPALLTVALQHKTTGEFRSVYQKVIAPGAQNGAATTPVGTVTVLTHGDPTDPSVRITFA